MARAHRIGQQRHVSIYRFVTKGTIEEDILERARRKMILEYASRSKHDTTNIVINQMDTTGAHINGTDTPKANKDYTKEELSAILKFGAQTLFKTDEGAQTQKLDEMDLDDVLTKADAFDTEAAGAGTTSLGGEGFLSSFAEIQDVKNDLDVSWDDIIPVEERTKLDEELAQEQASTELGSRKRTAARAPVSYEGMDTDKDKKPAPPRKSGQQKALELRGRFNHKGY